MTRHERGHQVSEVPPAPDRVKTPKKSRWPLWLGLAGGVLLLGCCGSGVVVVLLIIFGSGEKHLGSTFPVEEKSQWLAADPTMAPYYEHSPGEKIPYKAYRVTLRGGKTYVIELIKGAGYGDPYLVLQDAQGQLIEADFGTGNGAGIQFTPAQSGTYRIVAATRAEYYGEFTLVVREKK
jgi:hypothetical protein